MVGLGGPFATEELRRSGGDRTHKQRINFVFAFHVLLLRSMSDFPPLRNRHPTPHPYVEPSDLLTCASSFSRRLIPSLRYSQRNIYYTASPPSPLARCVVSAPPLLSNYLSVCRLDVTQTKHTAMLHTPSNLNNYPHCPPRDTSPLLPFRLSSLSIVPFSPISSRSHFRHVETSYTVERWYVVIRIAIT